MGFGDLSSEAGLKCLNDYLLTRSYIEGYNATQADSVVFNAIKGSPNANLINLLRWYNHIKSFGDGKKKFPGKAKGLDSYGSSAAQNGGAKAAAAAAGDDNDEDDLFGSDDEEDADAKRKEILAAYSAKKAKKPVLIAKSSIVLDIKPMSDETDMAELEKQVRTIATDGLLWGAAKLVPVAFGIKKLQISCVVEDDKVGTDFLEEKITEIEDKVQSVDVVAFNKL